LAEGLSVEPSRADAAGIPPMLEPPVHRRLLLVLAVLLSGAAVSVPASASVLPGATTRAYGADISWPNCPKGMGIPTRPSLGLPMPTAAAQFVVLGLTNGPGFTRNPCLASQVSWVRDRHLWAGAYAVTSYPTAAQLAAYGGSGTAAQRLFRAGAAEAQYSIRAMRRAGLRAPLVWVDVEPVTSAPWSASAARNNAVLNGAIAAYRGAGLKVGLYSYAYAWKQITGGRQLPTVATWVPSGSTLRSAAVARCGQRSFSGGKVYLGQWTVDDRDHDITCSGVTSRFAALFQST
jgi:hypothetical protein